jgi:endonuclease G, mitochondrial
MFKNQFNFTIRAVWALAFCLTWTACQRDSTEGIAVNAVADSGAPNNSLRVIATFPETFETGVKTAYTTANVAFGSGAWTLNDAVLGTSTSDAKSGLQSVRLRNAGKLSMAFDVTNGMTTVSIKHAKYSTDGASYWTLWASQNGGSTWAQIGSQVYSSSNTLAAVSFTLNLTGAVRLEIRKTNSTGRINIDDITLNEVDPIVNAPTRDDNLAFGNPSAATTITTSPNNYLMVKPQYALSYNSSKGGANWVSWHLSAAWKGTAVRLDNFAPDATLPTGFTKVTTTSYTNTGFDRGHQCPSDDRDGSADDNTATFLMTNMLPQAPNLNRVTWEALEAYSRTLLTTGNELYIIAGGYGQGGTGANGGVTMTIPNGTTGTSINVPARCWKVIVILPIGSNDLSRVTAATRIIAVDMPNTQSANAYSWGTYRTSVDAIEAATGYDILSALPTAIQATLESVADSGPTQ